MILVARVAYAVRIYLQAIEAGVPRLSEGKLFCVNG